MVGKKIQLMLLCVVLGVNRSGSYLWRRREISSREVENKKLTAEVIRIHKDSRKTYGLPRIHAQLRQDGLSIGKNRVARIMKKEGISGCIHKSFRVMTTDSKHDLPIAQRLFKTKEPATHPTEPNKIWASDISYISTKEGFLFLAIYLDLSSRKVVGFSTANHMRTDLLLEALDLALGRQNPNARELLGHSDRGSQYAAESYRQKLNDSGNPASMSRKGNCYDNAFAETFFATLKKELVYRTNYETKAEAKNAIFEYIEVWYNRKRLHSSLGYKSPVLFEESFAA